MKTNQKALEILDAIISEAKADLLKSIIEETDLDRRFDHLGTIDAIKAIEHQFKIQIEGFSNGRD